MNVQNGDVYRIIHEQRAREMQDEAAAKAQARKAQGTRAPTMGLFDRVKQMFGGDSGEDEG